MQPRDPIIRYSRLAYFADEELPSFRGNPLVWKCRYVLFRPSDRKGSHRKEPAHDSDAVYPAVCSRGAFCGAE